jgi:hypothetical protein
MAIDLLETSKDLPEVERAKFIDNLIDNHEIKTILGTDSIVKYRLPLYFLCSGFVLSSTSLNFDSCL